MQNYVVNASIPAVAFRRKMSKTGNFRQNCRFFKNLLVKYNCKERNVHKKLVRMEFSITFRFLFIHCTFQNSAPILPQKMSVFGKNDTRRLSNHSQTYIF